MLALWFLGLIDIRWRAADVSRQGMNWTGELKSNGDSTTEGEGLEGTERGKVWDGVGDTDLLDAGLRMGESGREDGWDKV